MTAIDHAPRIWLCATSSSCRRLVSVSRTRSSTCAYMRRSSSGASTSSSACVHSLRPSSHRDPEGGQHRQHRQGGCEYGQLRCSSLHTALFFGEHDSRQLFRCDLVHDGDGDGDMHRGLRHSVCGRQTRCIRRRVLVVYLLPPMDRVCALLAWATTAAAAQPASVQSTRAAAAPSEINTHARVH